MPTTIQIAVGPRLQTMIFGGVDCAHRTFATWRDHVRLCLGNVPIPAFSIRSAMIHLRCMVRV